MFILSVSLVLATTAYTEYAGSGDLYLKTNIQSPIAPSITDSVTIHTGCDGGCCCCPDCAGEYEGTQIVTNDPFSPSGHQSSVVDGCIQIEQTYYDEFDNRKTETLYYTYFDGNGTAESYVYAVPGQGMSYQFADGNGSSYVSFSQMVYLDENFDYETNYGAAAWVCGPGYVWMINGYDFYNNPGYYNPEIDLYCYPVNESSSLTGFLHAKTTDSMNVNTFVGSGSIEYYQDIENLGTAQYDIVATSYGDLVFVFEETLG